MLQICRNNNAKSFTKGKKIGEFCLKVGQLLTDMNLANNLANSCKALQLICANLTIYLQYS